MKKIKNMFLSALCIGILLVNGFILKAYSFDMIVVGLCTTCSLLSCFALFDLWGGTKMYKEQKAKKLLNGETRVGGEAKIRDNSEAKEKKINV